MSDNNLPPVQPCTDPDHTGAVRERLGCAGPEPTPVQAEAFEALKAKVGDADVRGAAYVIAVAYRAAAAEILAAFEAEPFVSYPPDFAELLERRADEIEAAGRVEKPHVRAVCLTSEPAEVVGRAVSYELRRMPGIAAT